jgi:DNA methylase/ParB-like nuclease family protein
MASDWLIEVWPIERFRPYGRNPRKNDHVVAQMEAAIREFGFKVPMLSRTDGEVVDGHLRLKAALNLGLKELPTILCDEWTPAQVKAFRILVNKSVEWADWDTEALNLELGELKDLDFDLSLTGFELGEIGGLLEGSWEPPSRESQKPPVVEQVPPGPSDEDGAPEAPTVPVSVLGDLWLCGEHRVLCGDSTATDATSRLFGGKKPELAFTDPPYGISVVKKNKVGGGGALKFGGVGGRGWVDSKPYAEIAGDGSTETAREFYHCAAAEGIENFIIWGGNYFTDFLPPSPCWAIWDKQNTGNFADVEMAWTSFDKAAKLYSWLWNGLCRAGDHKTELGTRVHPTQKPVGLFEKVFADFPFTSCYDGFLGSGSTLIACEKTGRACYGMELSPDYVDVIVTRWQQFTGKKATLEGDGRTFDELKQQRLAA